MDGSDTPQPQESPGANVTLLLTALRAGESAAADRLFEVVYAELRRRAGAMMAEQPASHTLQPTALVHEVYLRMLGRGGCPYEDRAHFFGAASKAMRSVLVDCARRAGAQKRGGDALHVTLLDRAAPPQVARDEVIAVHEALDRLAAADPLKGRLVEMRYFGGLEFSEIAAILGMSERQVFRHWDGARAWLHREMSS